MAEQTLIQRVTATHVRANARHFVPMRSEDLPLSYDGITREWLLQVTCGKVPGRGCGISAWHP